MSKIAIIDETVIDEIRNYQQMILKKLNKSDRNEDDRYISRPTASQLFDCDSQTIANFEKEGIIKRYGRGKFIRYSRLEIERALGIEWALIHSESSFKLLKRA